MTIMHRQSLSPRRGRCSNLWTMLDDGHMVWKKKKKKEELFSKIFKLPFYSMGLFLHITARASTEYCCLPLLCDTTHGQRGRANDGCCHLHECQQVISCGMVVMACAGSTIV